MGVDVDFTEVMQLADDFDAVAKKVGPLVRKAVEVSARNVKDGARERVRGRRHFRQAAAAIDYELKGFQGFGATVVQAEIGYNNGKPSGRLGNLIEFGAPRSNNSLPPGGELQAALDAEADDFVIFVEKAVADAMEAAGL